jgi:HPr Serine kinase C-terminal domain
MPLYAFHDLILLTEQEDQDHGEDLDCLLQELSWIRIPSSAREPHIRLSISLHPNGQSVPPAAREVFRVDGFCAQESGEDFYLTDGSSLLHLQPVQGRAMVFIAPSFFAKPPLLQHNFWAFGLLKLLRTLGLYSLHAAAVVARGGLGVLIIGPSGSGKSTLALGLIRQGWRYLSDDAVLVRCYEDRVETLALRKRFYIDADAAVSSGEIPMGEEVPDTIGRRRRRVCLEEVYPAQYIARCLPQVLLFSRIVPDSESILLPLDQVHALRHLLAASGPQLFDRATMAQHMEVLKRLVQQTASYELRAGLDLYRDPMTLTRLLNEAEGAQRWPAS